MRVKLISLDSWTPDRKVVLGRMPSTLGRGTDADIRVEDRWVSRCHCRLEQIGDTLVVRDLGSTHGTFVNGVQIAEAHVLPGDRLTVGMSNFQAQYKRSKRASAVLPHCEALRAG